MGTATRPATTFPASWDAFSDVDAFVDEVLVELAAMAADGTRPTRPGPKPALAGAELRKAIMAIWCTGQGLRMKTTSKKVRWPTPAASRRHCPTR